MRVTSSPVTGDVAVSTVGLFAFSLFGMAYCVSEMAFATDSANLVWNSCENSTLLKASLIPRSKLLSA